MVGVDSDPTPDPYEQAKGLRLPTADLRRELRPALLVAVLRPALLALVLLPVLRLRRAAPYPDVDQQGTVGTNVRQPQDPRRRPRHRLRK